MMPLTLPWTLAQGWSACDHQMGCVREEQKGEGKDKEKGRVLR